MNALGRHILIEFYGCSADIMNDVEVIEKSMLQAANQAEATIINSTFHHFSPYGVSGVIVIQESHLAIHTWPEYGYAALDLFTCGNTINPWVSFDFLKKAFKASNYSAMEILRGALEQLKRLEYNASGDRDEVEKIRQIRKRNIWFTDKDENQALSLRHTGEVLYKKQTEFQKVSVLQTYAYGKMLTIDNMVMCTEKDEAHYHEMITHPIMFTSPHIKKVLVIGGGDGGTVRELLKHDQVEQVTMVEIDSAVIEASKAHLKHLSSAFENPKLHIIIADGIEYVKQQKNQTFDFIIIDGSDPIGPAEGLFTETFYLDCYRVLTPQGALITQSESPMFNRQAMLGLYTCFNSIFKEANKVSLALFYAPTYPSGMWSLLSGFKEKNVLPLSKEQEQNIRSKTSNFELKYYNADIHTASMVLPSFLKEQLTTTDV